jgi:hypothetical protein
VSPPFLIDACECCEKRPAGENAYMDDEATVLCADCYMALLNDPREREPYELDVWRERALAAEARVRDLEETVGELVALVDGAWRA